MQIQTQIFCLSVCALFLPHTGFSTKGGRASLGVTTDVLWSFKESKSFSASHPRLWQIVQLGRYGNKVGQREAFHEITLNPHVPPEQDTLHKGAHVLITQF